MFALNINNGLWLKDLNILLCFSNGGADSCYYCPFYSPPNVCVGYSPCSNREYEQSSYSLPAILDILFIQGIYCIPHWVLSTAILKAWLFSFFKEIFWVKNGASFAISWNVFHGFILLMSVPKTLMCFRNRKIIQACYTKI